MAKKSTNAEIQLRVKVILDLYLRGYTFTKILRYASEQKWGITDRAVQDLMSKANELMAKNNEDKIKDTCNRILTCQWDLYEKCLHTRNPGVARLLLVDIGKTTGAVTGLPSVKAEVNVEAEILNNDELEELAKKSG